MNFTIILLGKVKTHSLSAQQEPGRWKRGDVVEVWLTAELTEPPSLNQPFIFVHITGAPNRAFQRIKDKLTIANMDETTGEIFDGRRRWRVRLNDIPADRKQELLDTRETTVTWNAFKTFIQNHRTGGAISNGDL